MPRVMRCRFTRILALAAFLACLWPPPDSFATAVRTQSPTDPYAGINRATLNGGYNVGLYVPGSSQNGLMDPKYDRANRGLTGYLQYGLGSYTQVFSLAYGVGKGLWGLLFSDDGSFTDRLQQLLGEKIWQPLTKRLDQTKDVYSQRYAGLGDVGTYLSNQQQAQQNPYANLQGRVQSCTSTANPFPQYPFRDILNYPAR